ncbi:MarR family winged helix-turn-helix transcriptional regulator [Embleya sp. NBC_00896]|uniref:MarR family winged helix-turn-helix transcriptional regulator n=1 Tax=Embleya sp. NBC_00896 TaxID=2975961 RepID=UPI002F913C31|nr:MarR family winged helix-turn-helix transcriptional regulator [Embleya sp. NBC_00896]
MNPDADFGVLLAQAYQQMVGELHEHLGQAGFTDVRQTFGYAFKALADEPLTTSQLANRLRITHQGAAKTVEDMVAAGYVERVPDANDRRVKRLVLTARSRELMAAGHDFHQAFEKALAARLGSAKVAATRETLTAITDRAPTPASHPRTARPVV